MRTVLVVLSGLLIFSGVVSATLWSDLKAERQLTTDLNAQLIEAKTLLHVATSSGPSAAAEVQTVITAAALPGGKYDSPPVQAPLPSQPVILTKEEVVAKAEQML